jgi:hypothetical protein
MASAGSPLVLWERDGQFLALASHFNAPGYDGPGLSLKAFRWDGTKWVAHGTVLGDSINNFPPKRTRGSSDANLSRVVLHSDADDSAGFKNVRVAPTREALVKVKVVANQVPASIGGQ